MNRLLLILFALLILESCATIFNSETQDIYISTSDSVNFKVNNNYSTYFTDQEGIEIIVDRDSTDLLIEFENDTLSQTISLAPHNSFAYWLNAYPTPLFWTGFLIDRKKVERYAFPSTIYMDFKDSINQFSTYYPWSRKGHFYFYVSVPDINSFNLLPDNETDRKINTGFWGIKIGTSYYYHKSNHLSLSTYAVTDFFIPFPAAVDFSGEVENMSSICISLTNNHWYKNWTYGYGIAISKNIWELIYYDRWDPPPPSRDPVRIEDFSLGFELPIKYQIGDHFYLGMIYRPSFFRFLAEDKIAYEHLLSFEFGWMINSMY